MKNVLAIACGIALGLGLGEDARAAIMTRGLAEMVRLAAAKGARPETLMGLSGLGDLALTCGSTSSRNTSLGIALGEGRALSEVLSGRRAVTEGVASSLSVTDLARRLNVEMPACSAVHRRGFARRQPGFAIARTRGPCLDTPRHLRRWPLRGAALPGRSWPQAGLPRTRHPPRPGGRLLRHPR